MNCNNNCKICPNAIISTSVTVVTVDGTDTLLVDLPAESRLLDGCKYCIIVAQTVPSTATVNMPVAFSIGGVVTTVYPFVNCNCTQITACGVQSRTRYPVRIRTNPTGGVFQSLRKICCYPANNLASLPVEAAAADTPAGG